MGEELLLQDQTRGDVGMVKIIGWLDNEWGLSNRMPDVTQLIGRCLIIRFSCQL